MLTLKQMGFYDFLVIISAANKWISIDHLINADTIIFLKSNSNISFLEVFSFSLLDLLSIPKIPTQTQYLEAQVPLASRDLYLQEYPIQRSMMRDRLTGREEDGSTWIDSYGSDALKVGDHAVQTDALCSV